jgi:hypothetical protein
MNEQNSPDNKEPTRINLLWDSVFKAVFTRDMPASREALRHLVSAMIGREAVSLTVIANEPAVDSINERQIRYDITAKFNDGELANIEMTLNPGRYEPLRMEYYSGKLFTGQDLRGKEKRYQDLRRSYQISFLVNYSPYDDDVLIHQFKYYDKEHETNLGGRTTIITVELEKVTQKLMEEVEEMSVVESWAVYLKYNADETKAELLKAISVKNRGVAMAQEAFLTVSRDEQERARLLSEYKYEMDLQDRMITAREEGVELGTAIGTAKGIELGTEKGIELERNRVLNLLKQGLSIAEIERQLTEANQGRTL